jgi:hypothetical protein
MISLVPSSEAAILQRLVDPRRCGWTDQAAQAVLKLSFPEEDMNRASELADKNNQGLLSPEEEREMESYLRLGSLMDLMQSKARLYLRELKAA